MEQHQRKEVTVKDAVLAKYNDDCFEVNNFVHISFSPKRKATLSQALDLSKRTILALDDCEITCVGNPEDIIELCPNLEELDLTNNHITNWQEVFSIMSKLDQIRVLNLSGNPLTTDNHDVTRFECLDKSTSLEKLILNNTGVTLPFVYSLLEYLTGVGELYLSLNEYSSIPITDMTFPNIKHLYLNEHGMKDWKQVMVLGNIFTELEQLTMTDCPLETVLPDQARELFPKLQVLRLNKTAICDWNSIDALNHFPSLIDVKLIGIPLLEDDSEETRRLLLARLPNITKINGAKVGDKEREDAERYFIRHHMDDTTPPNRYHELIKIHGVLDRLAEVNLDPPLTIKLTICYDGQPPFIRDINMKQTTRDFKKYLSNELGLPSSKMSVYYHDIQGCFGFDEMKYMNRDLSRYNMEDGDEIHVYKKV